jgi:hypothetical protein
MVAKIVVITITKDQCFLVKLEVVLQKDTQSVVANLKVATVFLF